jgi:molybdenum cofactor cytidylyltransferase
MDDNGRFPTRCYAIIPAAGRSARMGRHKLLLPFGDGCVMDRVLHAWTTSDVDDVYVVIRQADVALAECCRQWPVRILIPAEDPADMKASIQHGLQRIRKQCQPASTDCFLVAPADLPTITAPLINRLLHARRNDGRVIQPMFGDRRGHPVLLPWSATDAIFGLAPHEGLNAIIDRLPKQIVELPAQYYPDDMDTPNEYLRARRDAGVDA